MGRSTTDPVAEELRAACPEVTEAGAGDTVDGVRARWVASPGSTDEVAAVLRAAATLGLRVVPRGTGSRLCWGTPPTAVDLILDTGAMNTVLAHAAGDLVVTVQAGVALADLQRALAPHRQRLALDGSQDGGQDGGHPLGGTVGGVIATAASGPLRYRYGSVRDLIIGITVVLADGTVAKAGGTVVKNVAGYDLAKLYTGSLGTLGVITEAVFRLHPLPEAARWIGVSTADPQLAARAVAVVRDSQHDPVALEVDRPGPGGPVTVCVAVEGVAGGVDARAEAVARLLATATGSTATGDTVTVGEGPPRWWGSAPHPPAGPGVALTCEPTGLATVLADAPGALRGSAGAGVFAVGLPDDDRLGAHLAELRRLAAAHGGTAVLRCAPPRHRHGLDVWGPVPALALMRRLKDEFDPDHRLAPGRFVGGI